MEAWDLKHKHALESVGPIFDLQNEKYGKIRDVITEF